MEETLRFIGVRTHFLRWVLSLYSSPSACVRVNGLLSDSFQILNGTRQGCPLSPLIFVLTLEPFLCHIRLNSSIQGLSLGSHLYKVAAYADDLLFFLSGPIVSLPNLMAEFERYAHLSNFKINFTKSEALNVSLPAAVVDPLKEAFSFRWNPSSLKYLGIYLAADLRQLYPLNFPPLLSAIQLDCTRWAKGLFTWFGRCSIFKMNILPRLLYVFQCIPIKIPQAFFRSLGALQHRFVWGGKPARVKRSLLSRTKSAGGLGLPDLRRYFVATHLARVIDWCRSMTCKPWVALEQHFSPIPLSSLPWLAPALTSSLRSHPTLGPTLAVCADPNVRELCLPTNSSLTPVLGNPSFPPGMSDPVFRAWMLAGKSTVVHYMASDTWLSAEALASCTEPCPLGPWRVAQLRHFLLSLPPSSQFLSTKTAFESQCQGSSPLRHSLSLAYSILQSPPDLPPPDFLLQWEADLGISLSDSQRSRVLGLVHQSSVSSRFQEAGYKILSRWYRVPSRLHSIFPNADPTCWRCGAAEGTFLHTLWACPVLSPFWSAVTRVIRAVTGLDIDMGPGLFLLHHCGISTRVYKRSLLRFLVMAARSCIPLLWKQSTAPSVDMWISKVNDLMLMEDLSASLTHTNSKFFRTWHPWMRFQETPDYLALLRS